jgi:polyhydroxyalkanoate synthesis regulator phasin
MALNHLKRGLKIGIATLRMTSTQVHKELQPLIKAGQITVEDAREFVKEAEALGRKTEAKAATAAKSEAKKFISRMGYISKEEAAALRKKIRELEKKLKTKGKPRKR